MRHNKPYYQHTPTHKQTQPIQANPAHPNDTSNPSRADNTIISERSIRQPQRLDTRYTGFGGLFSSFSSLLSSFSSLLSSPAASVKGAEGDVEPPSPCLLLLLLLGDSQASQQRY